MNNSQGDLVRLADLDNDFIFDIKYATEDNFTKQVIYNSAECYIHKNTAEILIKAKNIFKKDGYRVKIWDAYRPISAQEKFWEIVPNADFVAMPPSIDPSTELHPRHFNGLCVDITLTDMDGNEIEMPTGFDDFSPMASLEANPKDKQATKNATYMREVMESVGFHHINTEWWHFYDNTIAPTEYLNYQI